jgi:hypothetical protein
MPVWFVFFDKRKGAGTGKKAAEQTAGVARQYRGMHVSYSPGASTPTPWTRLPEAARVAACPVAFPARPEYATGWV